MSKEYEFKDAKKPFTLHVKSPEDTKGTPQLGPPIPGDSRNCVLSRAGRREFGWYKMELWRTVLYVWKRENSIPLRYQVTQSAHDALVAFDASGRTYPLTVTFKPPRHAMSQAYQHSAKRKAARKRSQERSKARKASRDKACREAAERARKAGRKIRPRRAYTRVDPLTLIGVRDGRTRKKGKL